jgi:predicted MFS family arabinose efflux permease
MKPRKGFTPGHGQQKLWMSNEFGMVWESIQTPLQMGVDKIKILQTRFAMQKIVTRDFVLCFFAQFAFSSVFFILIPTIPIYLSRLGTTDVGIGVLIGALSVSSLILRPLVGRALLRIPEKKFMVGGTLLYTFSSVAYLFAKPFWPILIVRVFQGIGLAVFQTASFTLITRISPDARRGQSLSYFYLAINIAFALGPSIGMYIMNLFDFTILFLACTGLSLLSLFITLKLTERQAVPPENDSSNDQPFITREALPAAIMAFMGSIIWGALTAFFPLYALSKGVDNPGLFFAAMALTLIFGRALGGSRLDLYRREKVILPCLIAQIVAMTILVFSTTLPMFILVAIVWGIGTAFFYPTLVAYTIDLAGASRGPAMGTYLALSDFGAGMGSVIMGIVLQFSNYQTMFLALVLTGLVNLGYFHFIVKKRSENQYANLRIPLQ